MIHCNQLLLRALTINLQIWFSLVFCDICEKVSLLGFVDWVNMMIMMLCRILDLSWTQEKKKYVYWYILLSWAINKENKRKVFEQVKGLYGQVTWHFLDVGQHCRKYLQHRQSHRPGPDRPDWAKRSPVRVGGLGGREGATQQQKRILDRKSVV